MKTKRVLFYTLIVFTSITLFLSLFVLGAFVFDKLGWLMGIVKPVLV